MPKTEIRGKVTLHCGKQHSADHNTREYIKKGRQWNADGHVNPDKISQNITFTHTDEQKFFEETFSEAIAAYNEKNKKKHPDRVTTVKQYYQEHKKDVQEAIIQMGDHEEYQAMVQQLGEEKANEIHTEFLRRSFEEWQKHNTGLRVISAIAHFDETKEGTPHLHLQFLPVCESNRGLTVKVSMDGALKSMGFKREKDHKYNETPYKQWLKVQRERGEKLAGDYIEVIPSEPTVIGHKSTAQHKEEVRKISVGKKIAATFTGEKKHTIAAAQDVIDHAEKVKASIIDEAEQISTRAKVDKKKVDRDRAALDAEKKEFEEHRQREMQRLEEQEQAAQQRIRSAEQKAKEWEQQTEIAKQEIDDMVAAKGLEIEEREQRSLEMERRATEKLEHAEGLIESEAQKRAGVIVKDKLERADKYSKFMKTSSDWAARYQKMFGTDERSNENDNSLPAAERDRDSTARYGDNAARYHSAKS